jgi:acetyl esterase/lipase
MRRLLGIALLTAAAALAIAVSGALFPAPSRSLLPLTVAAPELTPWIAADALLLIVLALLFGSSNTRGVVFVVCTFTTLVSLTVLGRLPATFRMAHVRVASALRGDSEDASAVRLSIRTLFTGLPAAEVRETHGVAIGEAQGQPLTADIYQPATGGGPAIVQIYGGAWQRGEPGDNAAMARYLAARGYVVFAVDYRHAPAWRWPAQLEDVQRGIDWVRRNAESYDADPARMALIGRSAGGHLALMGAYASKTEGLRAVVSLYGPSDLVNGYLDVPRPDPIDVRATLQAFLGGTLDSLPDAYRDASPITYADRPQPPTLQIVGERDHIVLPRFARSLDQHLRAAGNVSALVEIPWADHAFDVVPFGPSAQIALHAIETFLGGVLKNP